jgi:hypothetical protein
MIQLEDAVLTKVSVHIVGNKGTGGELLTSRKPVELGERECKIIKEAMVAKFSTESERYKFHHLSSLDYNEVYNYCLETLAEEGKGFHKQTVNIAKHLYENTTHPKIKSGELYVCYFENCVSNGAYVDAIGIYKSETKSNYLDLNAEDFEVQMREGVDVSRFDKAALVLASNAEQGFDVLVFDNNRGEEAAFWKEGFLSIVPQANEYFQTNQFMTLTKQFIAKQIPEEFDMEKTEQIDLLNKSVEYFRANEAFDKKSFEKEVLGDAGLIKSFRQFGDTYAENNDFELPERFDISTQAVKKQARVFKSVLKLDKNFHIYIHGDKDLIEKGYDAAVGKNYYKIYYDEEA